MNSFLLDSLPNIDDAFGVSFSPFAELDRAMNIIDHEMDRFRRGFDRNIRRRRRLCGTDVSVGQLRNLSTRPESIFEHRSLINPIKVDAEGNRTLKCSLDLHQFKPDEVSVTLDTKDHFIRVEASHETKDENSKHYVKRNYLRHFGIPDSDELNLADLDIKSMMNGDGILSIEAPLPKLAKTEKCKDTVAGNPEPAIIEVKKV